MELNNIKPADGAKKAKRRLGRGIGSGLGKTAGRGHKGQKSRAGGFHKVGFEGGQMPMHRRLPKRGFVSLTKADTAHVRLYELAGVGVDEIDLLVLKQGRPCRSPPTTSRAAPRPAAPMPTPRPSSITSTTPAPATATTAPGMR